MNSLELKVFKLLRDSAVPLKAKAIASQLSEGGRRVDTSDVNRALYGDELKRMVVQGAAYCWSVREPYRTMEQRILDALCRAGAPLLARDIAKRISDNVGETIDVAVINGFLWGDGLRGLIAQDTEHHWLLLGSRTNNPTRDFYFG